MNAAFGAGTLVFTFLIGRRLIGSGYARAAAWLLTLFPYNIFEVLSYTPQIPGTCFFVAGIWFCLTIAGKQLSWPAAIRNGAVLGCLMLLAGTQRGGIDLLLLLLLAAMLGLSWLKRSGPRLSIGTFTAVAVAVIIWWPAKSAVGTWIESHDVQHRRSHVLGFITRGWNLVSFGEYFDRYEQLDMASAPPDKQRVLLSVLATQVVGQPALTLFVVPVAKAGKFFAAGYAPLAEEALAQGGYGGAAQLAKALKVAYAPWLLLLCMAGLIGALNRPWLAWRLTPLVLVIVMAGGAIVLLWEASPRYSQCIHFALVTIAALGFGTLRRGLRSVRTGSHVWKRIAVGAAAGGLLWIACGATVYAVARNAKSYLFRDVREMSVEIGGQRPHLSPLDRWTNAWEGAVMIDRTALPSTLRIDWPAVRNDYSQVSMSIWLPDAPGESCRSYRIAIPGRDGTVRTHTFCELAHMTRGFWHTVSGTSGRRSIEIVLLAPGNKGWHQPVEPARLAIGYVLAEAP
jgi:hypothetical protein